MMLVGIAAAFILGGAHALNPAHGKAIVGGMSRHPKARSFLRCDGHITHTVIVFALGLATLFLFRVVMPEKITQWLGVVSGLSIVASGLWMASARSHCSPQSRSGYGVIGLLQHRTGDRAHGHRAIVLYARNLLPSVNAPTIIRSATIVMVVGVIMTGISLGWIRPGWTIG
jgi:nickel/cobalt exporter